MSANFNYLLCLDIVVLACILVVAGRPDGLAITVSAVIIAAGALCYRCTVGVKSYVANKSRTTTTNSRSGGRKPAPKTPVAAAERSADTGARSKSWLRDSD
jgi:hypothetical protein